MRTNRALKVFALAVALTAGMLLAGCGSRAAAPAQTTPPVPAAQAPSATPAGPTIRILVTHPAKEVLERFANLKSLGLLPAGNLEIVGLVHEAESEDYSAAETLASEQGAWMRIEHVSCALSADTLFRVNACTPVFEKLLATSAGGGPDLPPRLYGEKTELTTVIKRPRRHYFELSLLFHLLGRGEQVGPIPLLASRPDYPVLAICLGMQTMNVATGGTMIQDIPSEIYGIHTYEDGLAQPPDQVHRSFHYRLDPAPGVAMGSIHAIRVLAGSRLAALLQSDDEIVYVLSAHHQAVDRIGTGLRVVATSTDGKVVEAVEHELFAHVRGVQFHPDYLELWLPEAEYRLTADAPVRNVATAAMEAHPESLAFEREIWLRFSRQATAAAGAPN